MAFVDKALIAIGVLNLAIAPFGFAIDWRYGAVNIVFAVCALAFALLAPEDGSRT
jgi:hypothetical protein